MRTRLEVSEDVNNYGYRVVFDINNQEISEANKFVDGFESPQIVLRKKKTNSRKSFGRVRES